MNFVRENPELCVMLFIAVSTFALITLILLSSCSNIPSVPPYPQSIAAEPGTWYEDGHVWRFDKTGMHQIK